MTTTLARLGARWRSARTQSDLVWFAAAVVYFTVLGGANAGEQLAVLRAVNLLLGAALIVLWIRRANEYDSLDVAVLAGVLVYIATAALSSNIRMSLDPAIQGLAYAALFWHARRLLADPRGLVALTWTFGALCIGISLFVAFRWGGVWLEWFQLTGFTEMPPLSLPLPTTLFLHRHDAALLMFMLAPAVLMPEGFGRLRLVRYGVLGLIAVLLVIDGSRTVMLSVVGGAVLAAAVAIRRSGRLPTSLRLGMPARVGVGAIGLALVAGAVAWGEPILSRLFEFGTLSARGWLWSAALAAWSADPISGGGPGTYLVSLFENGYYDINTYFPRNTDGAPLMILAETGVLGFLGLGIILLTLVRTPLRRDGRAALLIAPPAMFVIAGIGSVPADFGFLVVPALLWLAAAYPPVSRASRADRGRIGFGRTAVRRASFAALAVAGVAMAATVAAGTAYEAARVAIRAGDLDAAAAELRAAVALDPRFALYSRALGAVELGRNEPAAALTALAFAERVEPRDPVTARLQALAHLAEDRFDAAEAAADRALELQGSLPLNRLVRAISARAAGDDDAATVHVERFAASVPFIIGSGEWPAALGERPDADDAGTLLATWVRDPAGGTTPLPAMLLAGLAPGRDHVDVVEKVTAPLSRSREALGHLLACELELAADELDRAPTSERASPVYWMIQVMLDRIVGRDAETSFRLGQITGLMQSPLESYGSSQLSELWIYRRVPLPVVELPVELPAGDYGLLSWLRDPASAAAAAGARSLSACGTASGDPTP